MINENVNEFFKQNQPRQQNVNVNNYDNRNPFKSYDNGFQRRPFFVKTYQHNIEGQKNELSIDDQIEYEIYENVFYENAFQ